MFILTYGTNIIQTSVFQSIDDAIPVKPDFEDIWNIETIIIIHNQKKKKKNRKKTPKNTMKW